MRAITSQMLAAIQSDVTTLATCWKVTRTDGAVFGFTDHDTPILFDGLLYDSVLGYTASAVEATSSLSVSNMEIEALFDEDTFLQADMEAGLWSNAAVLIFVVNYADLTMGKINMASGNIGNLILQNGRWKAELRSLAQIMQQTVGRMYSPTCNATFCDSRCTLNLASYTVNGTVGTVASNGLSWTDSSLTQTGPTSRYTDTIGWKIPLSPYQIQIVPP
jgi:uncharacterized phage protein (TIGR02218 family)